MQQHYIQYNIHRNNPCVPDSNSHDVRLSSPVTPAGLSRLVWPGLLLASFTANLLFAGLCVYYQWGWIVRGSTAATKWLSVCPRCDLGGRQTASGCCLCSAKDFYQKNLSCAPRFGGGSFGWNWLGMNDCSWQDFWLQLTAPVFFFYLGHIRTHARTPVDFTQLSLALALS